MPGFFSIVKKTLPPAPVANNDSAGTPMFTPISVYALNNDTGTGIFIEDAVLTEGSASVSHTDTYVQVTPDDFAQVKVTYTIEDDYGRQDSAVITVDVFP